MTPTRRSRRFGHQCRQHRCCCWSWLQASPPQRSMQQQQQLWMLLSMLLSMLLTLLTMLLLLATQLRWMLSTMQR
jgi:hypothetical protein